MKTKLISMVCSGVVLGLLVGLGTDSAVLSSPDKGAGPAMADDLVVFGYNDLGMHCMNEDFSELVILPPFNNLRAQVIRREREPDIITNGVALTYVIPSNTHSADKSNFWIYDEALFGVDLPPNIGLTGKGLAGTMERSGNYFEATGIPITPIDDNGRLNPYPLATITVKQKGQLAARTQAVVPVSQEITCNLCHVASGVSTATDILRDHDRMHGTDLENQKPVLCANCHADPALGLPGDPDLPTLSGAMHTAHAPRMEQSGLDNVCYACHPGIRTQCQRDVHLANGVECISCHGSMADVGDPDRMPWVDEPRCGDCHQREEFEFEERGKLFKDSRGHGNVLCAACHSSPHAITPTLTDTDNAQAIRLQGHTGVINDCLVCHTSMPGDDFEHKRD